MIVNSAMLILCFVACLLMWYWDLGLRVICQMSCKPIMLMRGECIPCGLWSADCPRAPVEWRYWSPVNAVRSTGITDPAVSEGGGNTGALTIYVSLLGRTCSSIIYYILHIHTDTWLCFDNLISNTVLITILFWLWRSSKCYKIKKENQKTSKIGWKFSPFTLWESFLVQMSI